MKGLAVLVTAPEAVPKIRGSFPGPALERMGEISGIRIAQSSADIGERHIGLHEQRTRLLESHPIHQIAVDEPIASQLAL